MARILVVDDEGLFIRMIEAFLETNWHKVIIARDGREGLDKAKSEKPDLIILDIIMPEISGLKVCRILKNDDRYSKIPIIILSSKDQKDDFKAGKEAGADAYIAKPYDATNLLAKIEELLKKS